MKENHVLGVFVLGKIKTYEMKILQKKLSHCKEYNDQYLLIVLLLDLMQLKGVTCNHYWFMLYFFFATDT